MNEANLKGKELAYTLLATYYCQTRLPIDYILDRQVNLIQQLVVDSIDSLNVFTKTRAAKIVRQMID